MKVLICMSSPREHGNTADVVSLMVECLEVLAEQENESLEIETLFLGRVEIGMCQGCRVCFDRGEAHCPLRDDMPRVRAAMESAEGLIVASPVYVDDVNGVMKNWIDRLAHLCHRPQFAGRPAYSLATVGVGPAGHALKTLERALLAWGYTIVGKAGYKTGARMRRDQIREQYGKRIERGAARFFRAIADGRSGNPSFFSLMIFRIKQRYWWVNADDSLDCQFWKSKGWLDRRRDYYISHRAAPLKVLAARAVGALLAPFVT